MRIVLITGHGGNIGAKTITAGLVGALHQRGYPTLTVDLCPSNLLRLHFGMDPQDNNGWARQIIQNQPIETVNYRSRDGIDFIPFGALSPRVYQQWISTEPNIAWLNDRLMRLDLPPETLIIGHAPTTSQWLWQSMAKQAQQLEVFSLDALTLMRMEQAAPDEDTWRTSHTRWLINGFDATRPLDRDMELVVRGRFKSLIAPITLHRDEHYREALAQYTTIQSYAPSSQGAHDMRALALWLLNTQNQETGV